MEQNNNATIAAARVLADRSADACGVNRDDNWKIYSDDFVADAKAALEAANYFVAAPAVDAAKLDDLGKLKALAEAAKDWVSPAAWDEDRPYSDYEVAGLAFNAAANPATILRIAALVAQQAARIAELVSGLAAAREMVGHPDNVAFIDRALAGATQEGK